MTSRLSQRVGVLVVVVVTLLIGRSAFAQGGGPFLAASNSFTQVMAKLDQILAALSPAAPQARSVTLNTGLLYKVISSDATFCVVTNLRTTPLTVTISMRTFGGPVGFATDPPITLAPGGTGQIGSAGEPARCEFSFVGFADDVRASTQVVEAGTGHISAALEAR